jgi:hypothetical protein
VHPVTWSRPSFVCRRSRTRREMSTAPCETERAWPTTALDTFSRRFSSALERTLVMVTPSAALASKVAPLLASSPSERDGAASEAFAEASRSLAADDGRLAEDLSRFRSSWAAVSPAASALSTAEASGSAARQISACSADGVHIARMTSLNAISGPEAPGAMRSAPRTLRNRCNTHASGRSAG